MKIIQHGTAICKWGWSLHMLVPCVPAGGEGAPLIHWLSSFTKEFGESLALGQEFMVSVTETHISSVNLFPMVRIGMIATNLTAPPSRVIDGHARLVTKSDIEKLKSKKMSDKINQVEEALEAAWHESSKSKNENFKAFGRMMIRSSLLLLQKEKSGREKAVYTLDEIKSMFKQDLQSQAEAAVEAPSSSSKPDDSHAVALKDAKNPYFLASKTMELATGKHYIHKDFPDKIWVCVASSDQGMELKFTHHLSGQVCALNVRPEEIHEKLKITKTSSPHILDPQIAATLFPSSTCEDEAAKAAMWLWLHDNYNEHDTDETMVLFQDMPKMAMFACENIKKGGLTLLPATDKVGNIVKERPSSKECAQLKAKNGSIWFILPPKGVKCKDDSYSGVLAPYWLVKEDPTGKFGQMEKKMIKFKDHEVECFTNTDPILKHDMIALKLEKGQPAKKQKTS